jgi:hypothetical protein
MGARREVVAGGGERYRSAGRAEKGRALDELCAVTGWHRKHAVRKLADRTRVPPETPRRREPTYGATIKDAFHAAGKSRCWEVTIAGERWYAKLAGRLHLLKSDVRVGPAALLADGDHIANMATRLAAKNARPRNTYVSVTRAW